MIITKVAAKSEHPDPLTEAARVQDVPELGGERLEANHKQIALLGRNVKAFNRSAAAVLRWKLMAGFNGSCGLLAILFGLLGGPWLCGGTIGLCLLSWLCYFFITGIARQTVLYIKLTQLVRDGRPADWLIVIVSFVVLLAVLVQLVWLSLGIFLAAMGLALFLYLTVDQQVDREQRGPIDEVERLLKDMRRGGADEASIRQFVCVDGGPNWEPIYESIFGYEVKLEARNRWGRDELGRTRKKHHAWRDPMVVWLDARIQARREPPEVPPETPPKLPPELFPDFRKEVLDSPPARVPDHENQNMGDQTERARQSAPKDQPRLSHPERALLERVIRLDRFSPGGWLRLLLGPRTRFLVGVLLIAGCVLWMHQNGLLPGQEIKDLSQQLIEQNQVDGFDQVKFDLVEKLDISQKQTEPLALPLVPGWLTKWFDGYDGALAGLLLVFSVFFSGVGIAFFLVPAAVVTMFGHHWPISSVANIPSAYMGLAVALALVLAGLCFWAFTGMLIRTNLFDGVTERQLVLLNARGQLVHQAPRLRSPQGAKVLKLFRTILTTALKRRASDIHFEPESDGGVIRMRVDGSMADWAPISSHICRRLLNLVKVLCEIDITKKKIAQEGHFSATWRKRRVDYRVNVSPAVHGQKLVIRILDPAHVPQETSQLLMPDWMLRDIRTACARELGMLLVCGPTGSGKTTTLYTILREIDVKHRNVMTIEDPVEYGIEGATQISVNEQAGSTFSSLLRSGLRQDPDVILVGEIRDPETARTAMQAAMTGHLVLSTVHAKDTVSTIIRLLDLGVEPNLLCSSLNLILAQRLIRLLCDRCKVGRKPKSEELTMMGSHGRDLVKMYDPAGCPSCLGVGYRGRRAVFELVVVNDDLRDTILASPTVTTIREMLHQRSSVSLKEMAWQAVAEGKTSFDEVTRVTLES